MFTTGRDLIFILVDTVSRGGNLLLDIGPRADGTIPLIMEQRLEEIGDWLKVNGEAIYGTRPWKTAAEGKTIRYTSKGNVVYAICTEWPGKELVLDAPEAQTGAQVTMLGLPQPLTWTRSEGKLRITIPQL